MSKRLISLCLILLLCSSLVGCKSKKESENKPSPTQAVQEQTDSDKNDKANEALNAITLEINNYFDAQKQIDDSLIAEAEKKHSFEDPLLVVNPYGNAPLTAVAIFSTDSKVGGKITVKGKDEEDNIEGTFEADTDHIIPVYGLYPAGTTEVVISLDDGRSKTVSITTDTIDMDTEGIKAQMSKPSDYDYSKLTFIMATNGYLYAVDSKGDVRWFMKKNGVMGVKVLTNGHLILPSSYTSSPLYYQSGIIEMDLLGKVYREYAIPGGMHHDIVEMPDGNYLVAANRPGMETVEDYVVELDRETGEIVWELDVTKLIDPKEGGSINRTDEDWLHNNGVWYDEKNDLVLLSNRHTDAIAAVNKKDKTLAWILGDPEGWSEEYKKYFFKPVGDNFEWQYAQHQVSILSNGDIMCFDNGAGRTKVTKPEKEVTGDDVYSRAVIYRIDTKNMTIKQIWQYGKEIGGEYYSEYISGAIELDSDPKNIWITFGANLYNPEKKDYDYGPADLFNSELIQSTKIIQVKNDKLVYKLTLPHHTYRTLREAPYKDISAYDVKAEGSYLGSMGASRTVNATVDLSNAELKQDIELTLDPIMLTFKASYKSKSADNPPDSYLVLKKADDSRLVYSFTPAVTTDDGSNTATVSGWISTKGLEGQEFYIYLFMGDKAYFTGKKIKI